MGKIYKSGTGVRCMNVYVIVGAVGFIVGCLLGAWGMRLYDRSRRKEEFAGYVAAQMSALSGHLPPRYWVTRQEIYREGRITCWYVQQNVDSREVAVAEVLFEWAEDRLGLYYYATPRGERRWFSQYDLGTLKAELIQRFGASRRAAASSRPPSVLVVTV